MPVEIVDTLSNEDYHKDKAIGKSGLDKIHRSMNHFLLPQPTKASAALVLGSALHTSFLEPEKFDLLFIKEEKHDGRTKEGKKNKKEFEDKAKNKTILTENQWESVKEMHNALSQDKRGQNLFQDGKPEVSLFWDELDIRCKARPDWVIGNGRILIDIKTTQDASPDPKTGFPKAIFNYRYHVQAAWYTRAATVCYGEKPESFVFVAVESSEPFNVGVYTLGMASREEGWQLATADLRKYKDWLNAPPEEKHQGYSEEILELEIPPWGFTF